MKPILRSFLFILIVNYLAPSHLYGQTYKSQIAIYDDNDQYINPNHDRYYTDGVGFTYSHILPITKDANSTLVKKIFEIEGGQKIYNSYTADAYTIQKDPFVFQPFRQDRPFTAYAYAGASLDWLYADEESLKATVDLGTIGPLALGKQIQQGTHNLLGLYPARGWKYQLNNAPGINLRLDYKALLYRNSANWFDIAFNPTGWLGNTFTGASAGMQIRIGGMGKFYQSAITNSLISNSANGGDTHEFYFFTVPQINYVAYDATIEGGLWLKDKGPVTFGIYHVVYQQQFGLQYVTNRWSLNYTAFIRTREVKSSALGDQWASLNFAYRFGKI